MPPTTTIRKTKKASTGRYTEAVGRRKTSVARVRIFPGSKTEIIINNRSLDSYFPTAALRQIALAPFAVLDPKPKLKLEVRVKGGGVASQAGAVSHGLARALINLEPELRPLLKKPKLLRRDSRMKERRKFGLKKARKAPQWSKR